VDQENQAVGIDIGGTKTGVAAVDGAGRIHARKNFATRSDRGFNAGVSELLGCVRAVLHESGWRVEKLRGIGIGCTGPVNPLRGTIHNPYTLPGWDGANIVQALSDPLGVPVRLENDADAAALGEFHFGAGRNASPLVMVTLGTGVGGAVLVEGAIYRGVAGEHPELGHVPVRLDGPECYCGSRGCWESLASGPAVAAAGRSLGFQDSRAVFAAASQHAGAAAIVQRAVDATATATWTLLHTCLPQCIVIGGGIGEEHFDRFATAMRAQVERAAQVPKGRVEIVKARLGKEAGVIGAACLALG